MEPEPNQILDSILFKTEIWNKIDNYVKQTNLYSGNIIYYLIKIYRK
jgi:hypothetical protein